MVGAWHDLDGMSSTPFLYGRAISGSDDYASKVAHRKREAVFHS